MCTREAFLAFKKPMPLLLTQQWFLCWCIHLSLYHYSYFLILMISWIVISQIVECLNVTNKKQIIKRSLSKRERHNKLINFITIHMDGPEMKSWWAEGAKSCSSQVVIDTRNKYTAYFYGPARRSMQHA